MAAHVLQQASPAAAPTFSKPTLLDVPISNNGARCRYVIYRKQLEEIIDIQSPKVLGGLKSEQYMACNPQGKMPVLSKPLLFLSRKPHIQASLQPNVWEGA